jgi:polar amino acid transport system substrate-binding protein
MLLSLLLAAVLVLGGCADPLVAARAQLAATGELRAAVLFANPLLGRWDSATGQPTGLTAEFARAYGEHLGVPVRLLGYSQQELTRSARENAWDLALMLEDNVPDELMEQAGQLMAVEVTGLVRDESPLHEVTELDRAGLRLAVESRGPVEAAVAGRMKSATLVPVGSVKKGVQLLKEGRADVLVHTSQQLATLTGGGGGMRLLTGRLLSLPVVAVVPRGRPAGRSYTERFIVESRQAPPLRQLLERAGLAERSGAP